MEREKLLIFCLSSSYCVWRDGFNLQHNSTVESLATHHIRSRFTRPRSLIFVALLHVKDTSTLSLATGSGRSRQRGKSNWIPQYPMSARERLDCVVDGCLEAVRNFLSRRVSTTTLVFWHFQCRISYLKIRMEIPIIGNVCVCVRYARRLLFYCVRKVFTRVMKSSIKKLNLIVSRERTRAESSQLFWLKRNFSYFFASRWLLLATPVEKNHYALHTRLTLKSAKQLSNDELFVCGFRWCEKLCMKQWEN